VQRHPFKILVGEAAGFGPGLRRHHRPKFAELCRLWHCFPAPSRQRSCRKSSLPAARSFRTTDRRPSCRRQPARAPRGEDRKCRSPGTGGPGVARGAYASRSDAIRLLCCRTETGDVGRALPTLETTGWPQSPPTGNCQRTRGFPAEHLTASAESPFRRAWIFFAGIRVAREFLEIGGAGRALLLFSVGYGETNLGDSRGLNVGVRS